LVAFGEKTLSLVREQFVGEARGRLFNFAS
jgi:hypothetical protein